MLTINWDDLPLGDWTQDIASWSDDDKKLAEAAVNLSRALTKLLPKSESQKSGVFNPDPFIKIPALAENISESIWYGESKLLAHVRDVILKALLMEMQGAFPRDQ